MGGTRPSSHEHKPSEQWIINENTWQCLTCFIYDKSKGKKSGEFYLLRYNAVRPVENQPAFRRSMSPSSSRSKSCACYLLHSGFLLGLFLLCRSQWPRGLRHEPPSPARTLGSWVRVSLEAWMSVCVYSVCT
jgi:hypothetical protein